MVEVKCPYCNEVVEIEVEDNTDEGIQFQHQCPNCEKNFVYTASVTIDFTPARADCLNDGVHDWKPTCTYPPFAKQMECQMCGERRTPSETEREIYKIPTRDEWFASVEANNGK